MAKKKKSSNLGKVLSLVAIVLGIVAVCMMFVNTIKVPDTIVLGKVVAEGEGYTGLNVVFGVKEGDIAMFDFSIMALLTYLLIVVSVVFSVLNLKAKKNKVLDIVACLSFVVAGILCFLMPSLIVFADTIVGKGASLIEYEVTTGAIVSAIASIVSALTVLVKLVVKK